MKQVSTWVAALALLTTLGGTGVATAAPRDGLIRQAAAFPVQRAGMYSDYSPREAVKAGLARPLPEVLAILRPQVPGTMRDASMVERNGRFVYLIRYMMDDGNIAIVSADALTGQLLNIRRGGR